MEVIGGLVVESDCGCGVIGCMEYWVCGDWVWELQCQDWQCGV